MSNRLRRWLHAIPLDDPIERRQAMLVQAILLGLGSVPLFSALITLVASPFTPGALAAGICATPSAMSGGVVRRSATGPAPARLFPGRLAAEVPDDRHVALVPISATVVSDHWDACE